ncbi:hypothetical protein MMC13_007991 [Lambiella insularis]|nr:hypothetical protein [Lambiella insularis]
MLSQALAAHHDYVARNLDTISNIYNLTVYPNNVPVINHGGSAVPAGLFNENATGRITPVGSFQGFNQSIEYFFGLAPVPGGPTNATIHQAVITSFQSGCPEVASSVVYLVCNVTSPGQPDDGKYIGTLKQVANWHFDKDGAVTYYDAWIPNLQNWTQLALGSLDINNPEVQAGSIEGVCSEIQQRCIGSNAQYSSVADCVSVLSNKPYGNDDEAWGDNFVCRSIHTILTKIDPNTHCPHVGPTGGGKCIDISYYDAYIDDVAIFGSPLEEIFMCPRKNQYP